MQELIIPQTDFLIAANPLANLPGRETVFELLRHPGPLPPHMLWQLIGRGPDFEFDSGPTAAVVSVQARFKAAGVHSLRALDCGDPAGCLAEHDYQVFEPKYDELLHALLGKQEAEARQSYERLHASCTEGERRKLVDDLEHLLPRPETGPAILSLLLYQTSHIKDFLQRRTRSFHRTVISFDDICQKLFEKISPKLDGYKPEGKFHVYLAKAAHSLCVDEARKRRPSPGYVYQANDVPVASEDLGGWIDLQERLKQLPADDFKLFISHEIFRVSLLGIAEMMGISPNVNRNTRISKASREIERITEWLRGSDDTPPSGTEG